MSIPFLLFPGVCVIRPMFYMQSQRVKIFVCFGFYVSLVAVDDFLSMITNHYFKGLIIPYWYKTFSTYAFMKDLTLFSSYSCNTVLWSCLSFQSLLMSRSNSSYKGEQHITHPRIGPACVQTPATSGHRDAAELICLWSYWVVDWYTLAPSWRIWIQIQ